MRIALLGLGHVGLAFAQLARREAGAEALASILVRRPDAERPPWALPLLTLDPEGVFESEPHVVVDALPGTEPSRRITGWALERGIPVVSANKSFVADLLARSPGIPDRLWFEASVCGGLPLIETIRRGLAGDRVLRVRGILNGTTNFILGAMEQGMDYPGALREAQELGYAETDPSADVSGLDAARKLSILVALAFAVHMDPAAVERHGIDGLDPARLPGAGRIKLVAEARLHPGGRVLASVRPQRLEPADFLVRAEGAENAVEIETACRGVLRFSGPGAGGLPTAASLWADVAQAVGDRVARVRRLAPAAREDAASRVFGGDVPRRG